MNPQQKQTLPVIPVAWGEVFDKWTILKIKTQRISDTNKLQNIQREKTLLEQVINDSPSSEDLTVLIDQLYDVNNQLWDIENGKRAAEASQTFDEPFIQLARQVYIKNDLRAKIKKDINLLLGSEIQEEKSHPDYQVVR